MTTYTFFTVTDPLGTNGNSIASGINDEGQIVGYYSDGKGTHGFIDNNGIYTTFDFPSTTNGTVVSGIPNTGLFLGSYGDDSGAHGFFLVPDPTGTPVPVTFDFQGSNGTTLFGVSTGTIVSAGGIVGDYTDSSNTSHGFVISSGATLIPIDDPLGTTFAHSINDFGQVVGNYTDASLKSHGFLYSGASYTTLDDPLGTNGTFAYGINDAGQIVGIYINSNSQTHGFIYNGHTYTTIDNTLGVNGTTPFDINDSGQIVGQYVDEGGIAHGFVANPLQSPTQGIQNDYLAIIRSALPVDQALPVINSINLGTQTETQYVTSLLSQAANTSIPAVAVEGSMYNAVGTSAEITKLVTEFLPAQVTNAIQNGLNPQVYACEALGLVFAFGDENSGQAFATHFGPSKAAMSGTPAGDAAFAAAAASTIFGSAATANTPGAILQFVSNWEAFYTSHGVPGFPTATPDQIDIAARGAAWGDAVGVELANNLGPLNGQVINFLDDAAQGTAGYSASLIGQPAHQPFA
jgi:probable HAF family extracellular repeat protein